MKNPRYRTYLIIGIIIVCMFCLSTKTVKNLRTVAFSALMHGWERATAASQTVRHADVEATRSAEVDALKLENRRLLGEIGSLKDMVRREMGLLEELKQQLPQLDIDSIEQTARKRYWRQFNLMMLLKAIPAKIVYRSPAFWDQCCWVNVGTETNKSLGMEIVAKNSPVVAGDSIVGVIEEVEGRQSRVRLITDNVLTPSVRVLRPTADRDLFLAKGELHGSGQTLWRGNKLALKGVGFNYDFADEEGPARDLRTGKRAAEGPEVPEVALIKPGDLLVTTGMDGVFPPNFPIARVTSVAPLGDSDYTYEILAVPSAGNLDEITQVFVLPPWR